MMNDRTAIEQLYRTYWQYMVDKNAEGLRKLFTEDYCLEHMTGVKQSAETFLKGLLDGTFNYYSAVHEGIDAAVHGDTATLTGKSRVEAAVYGGGRSSWNLKGEFTLRKEQGAWKFTGSRASVY